MTFAEELHAIAERGALNGLLVELRAAVACPVGGRSICQACSSGIRAALAEYDAAKQDAPTET